MSVLKRTAVGVFVFTSGCLGSNGSDQPKLSVQVAPLDLEGVDNVCYDLQVTNDLGEIVWSLGDPGDTFAGDDTTTVCSRRYGNGGGGAIAYVGTCDATDANPADEGTAVNTVTIWVDGIYGADGDDLGDWRDPCEGGCSLRRECAENADTAVDFNLTVMRRAQQGFFDIAVEFQDIFCSAKVDVVDELLHDQGVRGPTAVVGFACTSGDNNPTYLYLDKVEVACDDNETYAVEPLGPGGNLGAQGVGLFQTAVYHDVEELPGLNKCFWNTSLGLDVESALDATHLGNNCTLVTEGTASETLFSQVGGYFVSPGGTAYPKIHFEVPLTGATGELLVGAHPLEGGNGVATAYSTVSDGAGDSYDFAMACGSEPMRATPAGEPFCGNGVVEAGEQCDGGVDCQNCECFKGYSPDGNKGCTSAGFCGDGRVTGNEECESPAPNCDWIKCQCYPNFPADGSGQCVGVTNNCGNGNLDAGEECELGTANCDGECNCIGDSIPAELGGCTGCGNGVQDPNEACEPDVNPTTFGLNCDPATCSCVNWYQPTQSGTFGCGYCGDLYLDGREQCDGTPNCQDCHCTTGQSTSAISQCITCGDGYREGTEQCESGLNCDTATCTCFSPYDQIEAPDGVCARCGDGQWQSAVEMCDDGPGPCIESGNSCTCPANLVPDNIGSCGCADGNPPDPIDGCNRSDCGNEVVDPGETCDGTAPGYANASQCSSDCSNCLNGFIGDGFGGCTQCGNATVDATEVCDATDTNRQNSGQCNLACDGCMSPYISDNNGGCTLCGNGAWDSADETCDPSSMTSGHEQCANDCQGCAAPYISDTFGGCTLCGNGQIDLGQGEVCDTQADPNCQMGCTDCNWGWVPDPMRMSACTQCGNGALDAGETCDWAIDPSCDQSCTTCSGTEVADGNGGCTLCGNNLLDTPQGEQCDGGDHCDNLTCSCPANMVPDNVGGCKLCGNGIYDASNGEDCDGGANCDEWCGCQGDMVGDGFGNCTYCGNDQFDAGLEACEWTSDTVECDHATCTCVTGNPNGDGTCSMCGDGIVEPGEDCENTTGTNEACVECACAFGTIPNEDGVCVFP